ncbi:carboxylesterase family protein [Actinomadura sp. ATCC 39365]
MRTAEGVVQGRRRQGHTVFRGIPYAQPPVGALRFAAPAPPHRWDGTRQAAEFGPRCRCPCRSTWVRRGARTDPMYDPAALAGAGLVVVTVNCRVGAEGFAFLDDAPPNRGFLDQIAALEWVGRRHGPRSTGERKRTRTPMRRVTTLSR